ncbi:adenylyl-sulfate kinase [Rhizobium sp. BR 318]|nr:adenylyl-sulfate kinase [Rhizobium paranaense]
MPEITRPERERLNTHKGRVIWFTGLSGSGKSTIAGALESELHRQGKRAYVLDGDRLRMGLNKDLGFSDADRAENIRRVAEVAKLMKDAGVIVLTACISPFEREREFARELIGKDDFCLIYVNTPLEICEHRDSKGLYKRARAGLISNMTGINSTYEAPSSPNIVLCSGRRDVQEIVQEILRRIDPLQNIS